MQTFVLTGAAGFLGSNILLELVNRGYMVLACDFSTPPENLVRQTENTGQVDWIQMDVSDENAWNALPERSYASVIHTAAVTPPEDDPDPKHTAKVNFFGTLNAMDWALENEIPRFVFTSSSAVYRYSNPSGPMKEHQQVKPRFSYGMSKIAAEGFIGVYREKMGLDCCAVRLPSIYGPWERPTETRTSMSPIYHIASAALKGCQLQVCGRDIERDWTYVKDATRGLIHLACHERGPELINLSTGKFVSLKEIVQALDTLIPDHRIQIVSSEPYDIKMTGTSGNQPMDPHLLKSTGFQADMSIKEGLRDYLHWLKEQKV